MKLTKKLILCTLYITTFLLIYNITKLNILNSIYLSIIIALSIITNIIISLLLIPKSKILSLIMIVLTIPVIALNITGTIYTRGTTNYLHKITNNSKNTLYEKTYQVIALKDTYKNIKVLAS